MISDERGEAWVDRDWGAGSRRHDPVRWWAGSRSGPCSTGCFPNTAVAPLVAYLHGPGGIGKSWLLRYAAGQAELAGRRVVRIDARYLDADPRRLEQARGAGVRRARRGASDRHLRAVPAAGGVAARHLPAPARGGNAIVVLASRAAPDVEWSLDPGLGAAVRRTGRAAARRRAVRRPARGVRCAGRSSGPAPGWPSAAVDRSCSRSGAAVGWPRGAPWEPTGDVLTALVERPLR